MTDGEPNTSLERHVIVRAEPVKAWRPRADTATMSTVRRIIYACVAVLLAATTVAPAASGATGVGAPRPSTRIITESPDFASLAFANGWDFSSTYDLPVVNNLSHIGFTNVRYENGLWKGTAQPQGHLRLLQSWDSIPIGRDGEANPIDANRFTHISIRMKVDVGAGAEVSWYDCGEMKQECKGATGFRTIPGWQTYDLELINDPNRGPVEWSGVIRGLALVPSARAGDVEIDWIRVYESTSRGVRFKSVDPDPAAKLIWDRDRNPSNNTATNPDWGVVATIGSRARYWNTDPMPPGRYFVYTQSANGQSAIRKITINGRPRPSVLQPDAVGGASYDTVVRGNAWDFASSNDVGLTRNMTWSIVGGQLVGTNASPVMSDSGFRLPLDPAVPIDGDRFHRLTARVHYAGGFSLSAAPGGGMNARIIWRTVNGDVRISQDIVVVPGWNTISVDLTALTAAELLESPSAIAWSGQQIELVRFDPHEDSGARQFTVDWIRVAENDASANNRFDITFRDRGFERRSTAAVFIDRDGQGTGRQQIGTMSVVRGVNTFRWTVPQNLRGSGTWNVIVEVTDRRGAAGAAVSTGTLDL